MALLHSLQLVVFQGLPFSLGAVAEQALQRSPHTHFVCLLEPGQSSEPVRRLWEYSIQPEHPHVHLFILHEPIARQNEQFVAFAREFAIDRKADLDVLYLSEASGFRESRRLTKRLKEIQSNLETVLPNCVVRRV